MPLPRRPAASSNRQKAMRWGVVYLYEAGETPDPGAGGTTPTPPGGGS